MMKHVALPHEGALVVYDLEYTAWEGSVKTGWSRENEHREIVEIGAVLCRASDFAEMAAFQSLVAPTVNPELSAYMTSLTGITNAHIANAGVSFTVAMGRFWNFCTSASLVVSNGTDDAVIAENYALNRTEAPPDCEKLLNIRPLIQSAAGWEKPVDSHLLPQLLGLDVPHAAHRALDDARSIRASLACLRKAGRL